MSTDLVAAVSFILISVFTPGPNNISSAAMGALHGFRKTRNYLIGIVLGFFTVMLIYAVASATVLTLVPGIEPILRYVGAAYTLYLAYGILKASYGYESEQAKPLGFMNGLLLQVFNVKGMIFGLTLFSTYLAPVVTQPGMLVVVVLLLTLTALCAVSVWAAFGSFIKRYTENPRAKMILNVCLSLFLVLTALDLIF